MSQPSDESVLRALRARRRLLWGVALTSAISALLVLAAMLAEAGYGARRADTTPPSTNIISGPAGPTRDNQPTFNLESSEAGSTFRCALDDSAPLPCFSSYQPPQPLAEGPHVLLAYATDPAGNTDPIGSGRGFFVDRSIAGARLSGARTQKVSPRELQINLKLGGQEALKVRVSGSVVIGDKELPTRPLKKTLGDRPTITPSLTAVSGVERTVARALKRGKRVEVEVSARFRDGVGNELSLKRTIVLR